MIAFQKSAGLIYEALCERDLKTCAEAFGVQLYPYQDYSGNEIDAVIELPDGVFAVPITALGV